MINGFITQFYFTGKGCTIGRYIIAMRDVFDKDSFKFLAGFAGILMFAIVSILVVGYFETQNGNTPSATIPPDMAQGGR